MAGDEHQAQKIVADFIVDGAVEIRHPRPSLELAREFLVLAL
jgi:hypothetical protein